MKQKFPEHVSQDNKSLLDRLSSGDISARDDLAISNVRLVLKIAHKFIPNFKEFADEIEDEAIQNLILKLERIRTGQTKMHDSNIGAVLNKTTVYRIQDLLKKKRHDEQNQIKIRTYLKRSLPPFVHNDALVNLVKEEILTSAIFTEREHSYIKMKFDGYIDVEIADTLGISKSSVTWIKKSVEQKLKDFI